MRVDWTNEGNGLIDIWATTVNNHRINVTATSANIHPFRFDIADGEYTDIVASGYAADLETAMLRGITKARELPTPKIIEFEEEEESQEDYNAACAIAAKSFSSFS